MENRIFIPGGEWAYFKLYTGRKTADAMLKNEMIGYVREMLKNNIIDKWFFIRYADPDFHIRLRLHLKETRNFTCIFNRFFEYFQPIVNADLVWNIQCDTYKREIERYGPNTISLVEKLFFIDSEFVIKMLCQLNEENPDHQRWKLALILIDSFLSAFSFDLTQREELLSSLSESFKMEFGFTRHNVKKQLSDKYRNFRNDIDNTMLWENDTSETINIIKSRKQAIVQVAEKITKMEKSGELHVPLKTLLTSIIHMTMNRWFRTKNRLHEMVIYEFLSRYYTSEIAKNNLSSRK